MSNQSSWAVFKAELAEDLGRARRPVVGGRRAFSSRSAPAGPPSGLPAPPHSSRTMCNTERCISERAVLCNEKNGGRKKKKNVSFLEFKPDDVEGKGSIEEKKRERIDSPHSLVQCGE